MIFQVKDYQILGNLIAEINRLWTEGKSPLVKIEDKKEDRSKAQNRLMHLWFKDIAKSTGNGVIYEAGRCKIKYFLPVLRYSENEEAKFAIDLCEMIYKQRGYEYLQEALGKSLIESTRKLSVKEFEDALSAMQAGEAEHNLTDPDKYGLNVWGDK